jgi:hypothetical protein
MHSPDDMSLESDGGMILTGENRRTRRKTCPIATLSTTNPTWIDPGVGNTVTHVSGGRDCFQGQEHFKYTFGKRRNKVTIETTKYREIQTCQKNWKEHVERMQDERLPKLALTSGKAKQRSSQEQMERPVLGRELKEYRINTPSEQFK